MTALFECRIFTGLFTAILWLHAILLLLVRCTDYAPSNLSYIPPLLRENPRPRLMLPIVVFYAGCNILPTGK